METYRQISIDVQVHKVPFAQVFYPLVVALLLLCTHSWGACETLTINCPHDYSGWCREVGGTNFPDLNYCRYENRFMVCDGTYHWFTLYTCSDGYACEQVGTHTNGINVLVCQNQVELDSANCALNPQAEGCVQEQDTTLYYCKQEYSTASMRWRSYIFKCDCKASNGDITSCNGKQSINVLDDCTPYRSMDGDCVQNGYNSGPNAGKDSTGANAVCFAVSGAVCHMKDKVSGNIFTCDCDGSCNVALRNLMAGNANCTNPYPQPNSSTDSLILNIGSSSSSSPESSEGGSSGGTSSGEGNNYLNDIRNNTGAANVLLNAIVNKDWNPTVNVQPPVVNVAGDTNIINVEVTGDTARAGAEILGFLKDTAGIGGYADQFESDRSHWENVADSVKNAVRLFLDSMNTLDTSWAKHGEDVDSALSSNLVTFRAYMDTIRNSPFNDTLDAWANALSNTGPVSGAGSNSCPAVLTRGYTLTIGRVSVQTEGLGKYLCTPIAGQSLTLWALARTMLRFMVAFGCMLWIYKAVTGTETNEEGE